MACLLQPECNFLHGFFRCKLPVEVIDKELKITSMQGVKVQRWMVGICSPMLIPRQLRFSLYSGAVITEDLMLCYYFFIVVLVLDLVLCLMPSS